MKTGAQMIAEERQEQIEKHGFSIERDGSYYGDFELLQAALFCIDQTIPLGHPLKTFFNWPKGWDDHFAGKIFDKVDTEQLRVAGAFIAAEIDRRLKNKKS